MGRHVSAIVVAAGRGERLGADTPKAFLELAGRSLLSRSLSSLLMGGQVDEVVVVVPPGFEERAGPASECNGLPVTCRAVVAGGARRSESVRIGFEALSLATEVVLVHDAARPFVPGGLVERIIAAALEHGGAIPAVPIPDTVKEGAGGFVQRTVPREALCLSQTPQGFRAGLLKEALEVGESLEQDFTDEAALFEGLGYSVRLVDSCTTNFKITTPDDWRLATAWAAATDREAFDV